MSITQLIKKILKPLVKLSPVPLTHGQRVDFLSARIIRRHCSPDSNTIDVGAHKGEILDIIRKAAPNGQHYGFEPLPHLFEKLTTKYENSPEVELFPFALSDRSQLSRFQYVVSNPAYSGLKRRTYDRKNETVREIEVEVKKMDDCIPEGVKIDLIKIDVEGAELFTLKGGSRILRESKPLILFEHGHAGADSYGYGAIDIWEYLCTEHGYRLFTLDRYLGKEQPLTSEQLQKHYIEGDEFYFVAC